MGFFKKFFSLGKKKGKNTDKHQQLHSRPYMNQLDTTLRPLRTDGDSEVAASRLLRSSSAHFRVVAERDFRELPPIPHPIDSVSRSNTLLSTTKNASVQTKNSYTVKVLQRELLSQTEFPNANPPLRDSLCTPRRHDYRSTPNLLEVASPPRRRQLSDPRKIPFTPRDVNRLNRLRQDPSVVSLLEMYDDNGRLDEHAFSNTPPPLPSALARSRRESTFKDLLRSEVDEKSEDAIEGDLSWAERCIAESAESTSSLSTISLPDSPPLETPTMSAFETGLSGNLDSTFSSDSTTTYPIFSSLEVELSTEDEDMSVLENKVNPDNTLETVHRITRTPSQRASQVFNFLSEKRERRKSQCIEDLLGQKEDDEMNARHDAEASSNRPFGSAYNIPQILINECSPADIPAYPLSAKGLAALALPTPSSVTSYNLDQGPRPKARSTGAAEVLRSKRYKATDIDRRNSRSSTGANVLLYDERQHGYGRQAMHNSNQIVQERRSLPRDPVDKGRKPSRRVGESRAAFGEITNDPLYGAVQDTYTRIPSRTSKTGSFSKRTSGMVGPADTNPTISYPKQLRPTEGKSGKGTSRTNSKKGTTAPELARSATTSHYDAGKSATMQVPMTPSRSRSLMEPASPASSSELSPEAKQMMADARTRKFKARQLQLAREKRSSRLRHE